ncbi:MAG: hypothetical protein R2826_00525 [Thermoleophilia bacterium]
MTEWEWIDDPNPDAPDPILRALAARGPHELRHGDLILQLADHDTPDPPDYSICAAPHLGWRRYRLVMLDSGARETFFDVLESQAFPVMDGQGDEAAGRRDTVDGARQFGLDLLDDAHTRLHEA